MNNDLVARLLDGIVAPDGAFNDDPPIWAQDPFNGDTAEKCGRCRAWCSVVRPGKTQCDYCCDSDDYGLRIEAAQALTETRAEIERLQRALFFWMPGVDERLDPATRELAADDAGLLAGYSDTSDKPCWGDGMIDRALAAESELFTLRARVREVVGPLASTDLLECKDCVDNDGKHYQSQWLADALRAARQLNEEVK